jgi:hypothetical protein
MQMCMYMWGCAFAVNAALLVSPRQKPLQAAIRREREKEGENTQKKKCACICKINVPVLSTVNTSPPCVCVCVCAYRKAGERYASTGEESVGEEGAHADEQHQCTHTNMVESIEKRETNEEPSTWKRRRGRKEERRDPKAL